MQQEGQTRLSTLWPEALASLVLLGAVFWLIQAITAPLGGKFIYCLDDAYIHMAIAKNLALHGVWGVTPYEFASASSSPLWILILALSNRLLGVGEWAPLVLNAICAVAALFVAASAWRRQRVSQPATLLLLLALLVLIPLPVMTMVGMEHTLHILLVLLWAGVLARVLSSDTITRSDAVALGVLAPLLTIARFESLFLVFVSCAVLFFRRQRLLAVVVGLCGLSSVAAFAGYSLAHGWHALPNSVLVKAARADWRSASGVLMALGGRCCVMLVQAWRLAVLLGLAVAAYVWLGARARVSRLSGTRGMLLVFAGTLLLHLQLAQVGWFYRYEAYLIALGLFVLGLMAAPQPDAATSPVSLPRWVLAAGAATLVLTFGARSLRALQSTPAAAKNIHDQQWQMARFLGAALGSETIAANDIGAIAFQTDTHIVDLLGLANLDTARIVMSGGYTEAGLERLAKGHHVALAVIYETPFRAAIPKSWQLMGQWKTPAPIVMLPSNVVSFYTVDAAKAPALRQAFATFSKEALPGDVAVWLPSK
jgi:hypothetical protein